MFGVLVGSSNGPIVNTAWVLLVAKCSGVVVDKFR